MKKDYSNIVGNLTRKYGIYFMLILLIIIGSIASPYFLQIKNITNVARQISITGILAFGETFVIISGCIDLSLGSVLALSGMVAVKVFLATQSIFLAILCACIVGAVCGLCSGLLVSKLQLPPFIATLAMDFMVRGTCYIYTNAQPVYNIGDLGHISTTYLLEIPLPVYFLIAVFLFCLIVLRRTVLGRNMYAVGGNAEAATASGISVAKAKTIAYILAGIFAGIAGVLQMARINSGMPDTADGYHGEAIAAAVIGGVSMSGGIGAATGTLVGAFIIGIISNIMNLVGLQSYMQEVVKGAIIVLAVAFDIQGKNRKVKTLESQAK